MDEIASQITSLTIVYSIVYSDADQRKHKSSASLAFVRGIHQGPVNSPHKWPVTRKMFPFDDVIMHVSEIGHSSTKPTWAPDLSVSYDVSDTVNDKTNVNSWTITNVMCGYLYNMIYHRLIHNNRITVSAVSLHRRSAILRRLMCNLLAPRPANHSPKPTALTLISFEMEI